MNTFINVLRQISLKDVEEEDEVLERTPIEGLHWIRTYGIKSAPQSRIVIPSQGQGNFSIVYHARDFSEASHNGYDYYGLHVGQADVLTFLATDDRKMSGHFVDCRKGSPTRHRDWKMTFHGDPDRALVVDRGIAHIFDNLKGMITLNQLRIYLDFGNPDFNPNTDVINVPRDTDINEFPAVQVNRLRAPKWLCRLVIKAQRLQLRTGSISANHPFKFKAGNKTVVLTRL